MLLMQLVRCAVFLARANAGNNMDASIAMIAIMTSSSIKVKALDSRFVENQTALVRDSSGQPLDTIEEFGCADADGVGDAEAASAVKLVRRQRGPVSRRRGEIACRERGIISVWRAASTA